MRFVLLVLCLLAPVGHVLASDTLCKAYYGKKQFVRAAGCYEALAKRLEAKRVRTNDDLSLLNQYYRNTALCLRRQTTKETSAIRRSHLFERAMQIMERVLAKKYYQDKSQMRLVALIRDQLKEKVGYVQVTLTTGGAPGRFAVTGGYRFQKQSRTGAVWQLELRPGSYTIVARLGKQTALRVVKLRYGQAPVALSFRASLLPRIAAVRRPVVPKPAVGPSRAGNPLPVVLVIAGGALAVAGIGMSVAGIVANEDNNTQSRNFQSRVAQLSQESALQTDAQRATFVQNYQDANLLFGMGVGIGGVGALGLVVGSVLWNRGKPAPPTPSNKKPAKNTSVSKGLGLQPTRFW